MRLTYILQLGSAELGTFIKGKDASACIGLTLIQHSSGGKAKIGTIGRHVKNSRLRTQLITGTMSVIHRVIPTALS
jgi:transposase